MSYCKKQLIQSENEYRLVGEDLRNKNLVVVLVVVAQIGKFVKCAGEIYGTKLSGWLRHCFSLYLRNFQDIANFEIN